ncbi:MAG: EamA family transporter [Planctomycetales bacterium]|nr:EamA family transporter [Planctomycetales bacterium]NIM09362.1 EamA family transporter [Planctomycetales bacterium]NIN08829.1 EamA family transporter [Planctomycetales bacterium]NIN77946.1 EamA family transporter [Planctomycetales bacterium]NIO35129.1 EamA family transporter [Planctomycetales bacterium]
MPYVLFALLCFLWGTNFILMKKAGLWFSSAHVGLWRVVGGALLLAAIQLWDRRPWSVQRRDLLPLLGIALFGYAYPFIVQPFLVRECGSGFIGIMVSFVPLLTVVVSIPILGVRPTPRQLIGVLGGLGFLLLILKDGLDRQVSLYHFALAIAVPLLYAVCNTFIKRRFVAVRPLPLALTCLALSLLVMVPAAGLGPRNTTGQAKDFLLAVVSVTILGVLGTGLGALIFTKLLQDHGPLFASMVTYLIPTIALVWGWMDEEPITISQIVGLAGALSMVAIVQYGAASHTPARAGPVLNEGGHDAQEPIDR